MSVNQVYLDLDYTLAEVISQTKTRLEDIDASMAEACNSIATLTVCGWAGESKDAFVDKFSVFKNDMRSFYEGLNELCSVLTEVEYRGLDVLHHGNSLPYSLT
jgi:uncharacterized protein YukE